MVPLTFCLWNVAKGSDFIFFENHISVDLLVHEKIECMFVRCVRVVILRRDWDLVT
jgi:hypothetical protein